MMVQQHIEFHLNDPNLFPGPDCLRAVGFVHVRLINETSLTKVVPQLLAFANRSWQLGGEEGRGLVHDHVHVLPFASLLRLPNGLVIQRAQAVRIAHALTKTWSTTEHNSWCMAGSELVGTYSKILGNDYCDKRNY